MAKKRVFTKDEISIMIKMYEEGETYQLIGKTLKTKGSKVSEILKGMGYGQRTHTQLKNNSYLSSSRKHKFNESYFETIDTQNKAYWLGFLFADGSVNKKHDKNGNEKGGSVELSLKYDDKYHVENFAHDVGYDGEVKDRVIKYKDKEYKACRLCLNSIKMVNDLISHGCFPAKSLILREPIGVPDDLMNHFVRGYFDGDGCVFFYFDKYIYKYNILGTEEFLTFIRDKVGLSHLNVRGFPHKKCYELNISSKPDIEKFHNYIYNDCSIFLERKYQKSLWIMKYRFIYDVRSETQKLADLFDYGIIFIDENLFDDFNATSINYKRSETAKLADLLD